MSSSLNTAAMEKRHAVLALQAAQEGIVLLQNNGALPLCVGKVALYGTGARYTIKGGSGSGGVNCRYQISVEEGLENAGFNVTTKQWLDDCDEAFRQAKHDRDAKIKELAKGENALNFWHLMEKITLPEVYPSGRKITERDVATSQTDTAIFVLSRQAGEGIDRKEVKGEYLLYDDECESLHFLRKHYKKLVLIINAGACIDMSILDEIKIDAVVYMAQAGQEGGNALAALLCGKANFCGKLAASWPYHLADLPAHDTYSDADGETSRELYVEDIYVGYRFHDTFKKAARFPFGFGLTYTSFSISGAVNLNGAQVNVEAVVRNTGSSAGREVVQLYASCPGVKIAREYQRLVAFGKTKTLAPGESEKLTLTFPLLALAYFDDDIHTYRIESGTYTLRLGNSSVDTAPLCGLIIPEETEVERCCMLSKPAKELRCIRAQISSSENTIDNIPVLTVSQEALAAAKPTAKFTSYASAKKYGGKYAKLTPKERVKLIIGDTAMMSGKFFRAPGACGGIKGELLKKCGIQPVIMADGPAGVRLIRDYAVEPNGRIKAGGNIPKDLQTAKALYYWVNKVFSHRSRRAVSHSQNCTAWPTESLQAQTFDPALLEQIGEAVAEEMKQYGVNIWLAPGMNIQRYPLCGRNYEYYSEDPCLTGVLAAAMVRGVQKGGGAATIKHFCCNNQETNRSKNSSEVTQRALREIYLPAFAYVVRTASPRCLMTSYNKVNGTYVNSDKSLINGVVRGEWGFDGLVMTDWQSVSEGQAVAGEVIAAGGDLIMAGDSYQTKQLQKNIAEGLVSESTIKEAICRILACSEQLGGKL